MPSIKGEDISIYRTPQGLDNNKENEMEKKMPGPLRGGVVSKSFEKKKSKNHNRFDKIRVMSGFKDGEEVIYVMDQEVIVDEKIRGVIDGKYDCREYEWFCRYDIMPVDGGVCMLEVESFRIKPASHKNK